jgi:hypothetical protein
MRRETEGCEWVSNLSFRVRLYWNEVLFTMHTMRDKQQAVPGNNKRSTTTARGE